MCSTCGCGQPEDPFTIELLGSEEKKQHNGNHNLGHSHDHDHHDRDHDHHHHHPERSVLELEVDILGKNNLLAERNRGFFEAKNILALNLVSSPGSGKTTLLEKTIEMVSGEIQMSVVEGDQQTANDAERIHKTGAKVVQINTGKGCHLDALMVNKAVKKLEPENRSILFIENVGNLVCPAMFDLGESSRVVIVSVTEGTDKPLKYPDMFESSQVCIVNKTDLLPYVDFDVEAFKEYALRINHHLDFIEVSATKGDGMETWLSWIKDQLKAQ
ncbi:hydrogenase nickel incorporation protein HypB [Bacteroidota bacterium]